MEKHHNLVTIRDDRIILLPAAVLTKKDIPNHLRMVRWRFIAGPKSGILIRSRNESSGRDPVRISAGATLDFSYGSESVFVIANSGNEEAILLRHEAPSFIDVLGDRLMTVLEHLGRAVMWLLIGAGYVVAGVIGLLVVLIALKVLWETGAILFSTMTYQMILTNPEATATLVGVLVTGLFGFSGIILTSILNARSAREQSAESDKKTRELQETIAREMDKRIDWFARAFERYHAETLVVLEGRDRRTNVSSPD